MASAGDDGEDGEAGFPRAELDPALHVDAQDHGVAVAGESTDESGGPTGLARPGHPSEQQVDEAGPGHDTRPTVESATQHDPGGGVTAAEGQAHDGSRTRSSSSANETTRRPL